MNTFLPIITFPKCLLIVSLLLYFINPNPVFPITQLSEIIELSEIEQLSIITLVPIFTLFPSLTLFPIFAV